MREDGRLPIAWKRKTCSLTKWRLTFSFSSFFYERQLTHEASRAALLFFGGSSLFFRSSFSFMTSFYRDVYLKSEPWKQVRNKKAKHHDTCAACGASGPLDAHHLIYPKNILKTKARHLRMVCRRCHDAIHELKATGRLYFRTKKLNSIWIGTQARLTKHFGIIHRNSSL